MPRDEFDVWDKADLDDEEDEEDEEELDDLNDLEEDEEDEEDEDEEDSPAVPPGEKVGLHAEEERWDIADPDDEVDEENRHASDEEPKVEDKTGTFYENAKKGHSQQPKRRASVIEQKKRTGRAPKPAPRSKTTKSKGGLRRK
jgi:hypothetical protein